MKDVLKIIVSFLYDEDLDLEVRTASLYTLYAFYCHQINKFKLKVKCKSGKKLSWLVNSHFFVYIWLRWISFLKKNIVFFSENVLY